MQPSDDAYLEGDLSAFETIYDRYAGRLLGFVASLGANRDLAEEACQKTWIKVIDHLEQYEAAGRFRPWLFTIAHRQWLDDVRSAWQRHKVKPVDVGDAGGANANLHDPIEHAMVREQRELLTVALGELPAPLRQTVLLRIDGALSFLQIAETMQCPLGTALWRMKEDIVRYPAGDLAPHRVPAKDCKGFCRVPGLASSPAGAT